MAAMRAQDAGYGRLAKQLFRGSLVQMQVPDVGRRKAALALAILRTVFPRRPVPCSTANPFLMYGGPGICLHMWVDPRRREQERRSGEIRTVMVTKCKG